MVPYRSLQQFVRPNADEIDRQARQARQTKGNNQSIGQAVLSLSLCVLHGLFILIHAVIMTSAVLGRGKVHASKINLTALKPRMQGARALEEVEVAGQPHISLQPARSGCYSSSSCSGCPPPCVFRLDALPPPLQPPCGQHCDPREHIFNGFLFLI